MAASYWRPAARCSSSPTSYTYRALNPAPSRPLISRVAAATYSAFAGSRARTSTWSRLSSRDACARDARTVPWPEPRRPVTYMPAPTTSTLIGVDSLELFHSKFGERQIARRVDVERFVGIHHVRQN